MKKIIAATAGLLLVGGMVTAASAEVTFNGDARVRMVMTEHYAFDKNQKDYNNERARIVINATTKGGAYLNSRIILGYSPGYSGDYASSSYTGTYTSLGTTSTAGERGLGLVTDWMYIGIPIGPVTINAGRMPDNSSLWFRFDKRADRVAATWSNKMTSVTAQFDKVADNTVDNYFDARYDAAYPATYDDDVNQWGVIVKQKFAADWNLMAYGIYQDNQRFVGKFTPSIYSAAQRDLPDGSGFEGTINANGSAGPVNLLAEFSYVQSDLSSIAARTANGIDNAPTYKNGVTKYQSGYGGIVHAKMTFGPAAGTLVVGFTKNGFQADFNYGFLMIGGAMAGANPDLPNVGSPITAIGRIGQNPASNGGYSADSFFTGLIGDYDINKTIKLVGILAYDNISDWGHAIELSGLVNFKLDDGAYINLGGGLLSKGLDKKLNYAWGNPALSVVGDDPNYVHDHNNLAYGVFTELGLKF